MQIKLYNSQLSLQKKGEIKKKKKKKRELINFVLKMIRI